MDSYIGFILIGMWDPQPTKELTLHIKLLSDLRAHGRPRRPPLRGAEDGGVKPNWQNKLLQELKIKSNQKEYF